MKIICKIHSSIFPIDCSRAPHTDPWDIMKRQVRFLKSFLRGIGQLGAHFFTGTWQNSLAAGFYNDMVIFIHNSCRNIGSPKIDP